MKIGVWAFSMVLILKIASKFWSEHFLTKKLSFWEWVPPKSDRKPKLSDFDEIWYWGVSEGADFKNRLKILVRTIFGQKTSTENQSCPISMKFGTPGFSRVLISYFGCIVVSFEFVQSCAWVPRRLCFFFRRETRRCLSVVTGTTCG